MYNRELLNKCDNFINHKIIYPAKYPEGTSFIRRWLRMKSPLDSKDIKSNLSKNVHSVNELIVQLTKEHPDLTETSIKVIVYERMVLNCKRNLGYSENDTCNMISDTKIPPVFIFNKLLKFNTDVLSEIEKVLTKPWNAVRKVNVALAKVKDSKDVDENVIKQINALKNSHTKYTKSKNLSDYEVVCLELFKSDPKSATAKKILTEFIEYAAGNKDFNSRLSKALNNPSYHHLESTMKKIHKFSYKSLFVEEAASCINKVDLKNPKFTMSEYGALEKIFSMIGSNDYIDEYLKNKINYNNVKPLSEAEERFKELQERIGEQALSQLPSFAIHSTISESNDALRKVFGSISDRMFNSLLPYSHSGFTFLSSTNQSGSNKSKPEVSFTEMYETLTREKPDSQELADSCLIYDFHKVIPINLISNDLKEQLKKNMAIDEEKLNQYLQERFAVIMREYTDKVRSLDNNDTKQTLAGLADIIPFGHKSMTSIRKWADKAFTWDANKPYDILGGDEEYICSEFVAKMTVLALVRLEQELKGALPELDEKAEVIKLPFGNYENLDKIHPFRLIKEMMKVGAIEKVDLKLDNYVVRDKEVDKHIERSLRR